MDAPPLVEASMAGAPPQGEAPAPMVGRPWWTPLHIFFSKKIQILKASTMDGPPPVRMRRLPWTPPPVVGRPWWTPLYNFFFEKIGLLVLVRGGFFIC